MLTVDDYAGFAEVNGLCCVWGNGGYNLYVDYEKVYSREGERAFRFDNVVFNEKGIIEEPVAVTFEFQLDEYAGETAWQIELPEPDHTLLYIHPPYEGMENALFSETVYLSPGVEYSLILRDLWGDGFCCSVGNGYFNIYYGNATDTNMIISSGTGEFTGRYKEELFTIVPPNRTISENVLNSISEDVEEGEEEVTFFPLVGSAIDGEKFRGEFGNSISSNDDGTILAVADTESVHVFRLINSNGTKDWTGENAEIILPSSCGAPSPGLSATIRSTIVIDISRSGRYLAVGCPFSSSKDGTIENAGRVEVYQKDSAVSWQLVGDAIYGKVENGLFGAAISMSGDGQAVAIGSPYLATVSENQGGLWTQSVQLNSANMSLSVDAVVLDRTGKVMAIGGKALDGGSAVVRVYRSSEDGSWIELGSGIEGDLDETSYKCDLSGDGTVLAVSNAYIDKAKKREVNSALDVRAFSWDEASWEWKLLGESLHGNAPGEKSGYFVTLNDDGTVMGMGDPGGRRTGNGDVTGHAHIYWYDKSSHTWQQLGPNEYGENGGDQFGYGVKLSSNGRAFTVTAPYNRGGSDFEHGRFYVYNISDLEKYISNL